MDVPVDDRQAWPLVAGSVIRRAPDGALDRVLEVPARLVGSPRLGRPDRGDLYVTTGDNLDERALGGSIFRVRVDIAGSPAPEARG